MSLLVRTCSTDRMNVSRLIARIAIALGGIVWIAMFAAAATVQRYSDLTYTFQDVVEAGLSAIVPALIAIAAFVLALFYERLAALLLFIASAAVVVWGVVAGWEAGNWVSMLLVLVMPMVASAVLLLLAASTQRVCELEGAS